MDNAVNVSRLDKSTPFDDILAIAMTYPVEERMMYAHKAIVERISAVANEDVKESMKTCFRVFNAMFGPMSLLPEPEEMDFV